MSKTLLYRLFRVGGIPKRLRPILEDEGIIVADEGIGGWLITRDFRAPGRRFRNRAEGFTGFLAITSKRVVAFAYGKPVINVPVDDPRLSGFEVRLNHPAQLEISFEASVFRPGWQGRMVLRFDTPKARQFYSGVLALL